MELIDKGWENFVASAGPIQRSTTLNAGVFSAVLVLAFVLFAFLYLRQKRNEFAIQRALGMPRRVAVRQFLAPVALLGTLGVAAGGISAWRYALGKAGETLALCRMPTGSKQSPTCPPSGCWACAWRRWPSSWVLPQLAPERWPAVPYWTCYRVREIGRLGKATDRAAG